MHSEAESGGGLRYLFWIVAVFVVTALILMFWIKYEPCTVSSPNSHDCPPCPDTHTGETQSTCAPCPPCIQSTQPPCPSSPLNFWKHEALITHSPHGEMGQDLRSKFAGYYKQFMATGKLDMHPKPFAQKLGNEVTVITYNSRVPYHPNMVEQWTTKIGYQSQLWAAAKGTGKWDWMSKIKPVYEYLASGNCTTKYVLCLDGDDNMLIGDISNLVPRFKEYENKGTQLLFVSTHWDSPEQPEPKKFEESVYSPSQKHNHLSAGAYMGVTSTVKKMLEEMIDKRDKEEKAAAEQGKKPGDFNDQAAWRVLHMNYYPLIKVDFMCRIFIRHDAFLQQF